MSMTPRSEALAYRIWAYCEPREWDCSVREVAEAIGEPGNVVGIVAAKKGWSWRLRASKREAEHQARFVKGQDPLYLLPSWSGRDSLRYLGIDA